MIPTTDATPPTRDVEAALTTRQLAEKFHLKTADITGKDGLVKRFSDQLLEGTHYLRDGSRAYLWLEAGVAKIQELLNPPEPEPFDFDADAAASMADKFDLNLLIENLPAGLIDRLIPVSYQLADLAILLKLRNLTLTAIDQRLSDPKTNAFLQSIVARSRSLFELGNAGAEAFRSARETSVASLAGGDDADSD